MSDKAVPVSIEGVCGNCVHWLKNAGGEIGNGVCYALPASIAVKGGALIKVRGTYAANERGCTALFQPRPEVLELAAAQQMGAGNEVPAPVLASV